MFLTTLGDPLTVVYGTFPSAILTAEGGGIKPGTGIIAPKDQTQKSLQSSPGWNLETSWLGSLSPMLCAAQGVLLVEGGVGSKPRKELWAHLRP